MIDGLVKEIKTNLAQNKNKAKIKFEANNVNSLLKITSEKGVSLAHGLAA